MYRRHFIAALAGAAATRAQAAPRPVLILGDSLSAEYGLARGTGWVALLTQRLREQKLDIPVINASISGETTVGGRSRLPALLAAHHPGTVVVALGGNDALRGLPLSATEDNLSVMVQSSRSAGAKVLLVGIEVPPNYGRDYSDRLAKVFKEVAARQHVSLVPSILKGVGDAPNAPELFQADRIHPLARAHPTMLANVWPALIPLLR